ncbi:MAG: hypothetical protein R3B95_17900 [Nitrospirales bacterium]|nr:hypothetical protein [Nitrospirales bacterium]
MSERSHMIAWIRGELVGPSQWLAEPDVIEFANGEFVDPVPVRRGPLAWRQTPDTELQEVLYFERETPHRKYGIGLLHPAGGAATIQQPDVVALQATDTLGSESELDESLPVEASREVDDDAEKAGVADGGVYPHNSDDFEVTSPDIRHPSTVGISFCTQLHANSQVVVRLPQSRRFLWQAQNTSPFPLNGRYESCKRRWTHEDGQAKEASVWRRLPAVLPDTPITIGCSELVSGQVIRKEVRMPEGSPLNLRIEIFPRRLQDHDNVWLLTVVLRNSTDLSNTQNPHESILYQTFFEVEVAAGCFEKYPESRRPFDQLDFDEQSLALLYREAATWAIGHGCAAGWDTEPDGVPLRLYADVLPAVQLPSMTPDITVDGNSIKLSMRALSNLSDDGDGPAWQLLDTLTKGYADWIRLQRNAVTGLPIHLATVATRHLDACDVSLDRMNAGITLLRNDGRVRKAFRLANLAMLLQQIATKQLPRRPLVWSTSQRLAIPQEGRPGPWSIYQNGLEDIERLGSWRAFQIAFVLMSLDGLHDGRSGDREIVDLIWFPTGGGKTEAYLAVMAFYMFHERLLMEGEGSGPMRDGTNVIMRYTLRMLTTQQFQRAASLISAMEFLRRNPAQHGRGNIPGRRFSLGLWIGRDGAPNDKKDARSKLAAFRRGDLKGNPLVLTECPWCRAEIGRFNGKRPSAIRGKDGNFACTRGINDDAREGPLLYCPDSACEFGKENIEHWLPVEVIDERIYRHPPSLVIATVDKLAMIAYRPEAGAIFGRRFVAGNLLQEFMPPSLIIQDELHLISGPLGTMYALYEGVFERLCSFAWNDNLIKPKLIASTATIRGAADQVKALYSRSQTQLFPSPGLMMGDSFFGRYARDEEGKICDGRLYLGIHASDYGSVLTTQVRAFSSALFRPWSFVPERRDPWWTLLAFYNSIRELGGARTLFDSDIRSRLKFMFNREGFAHDNRRNLRIVEELTGRNSQAEIVYRMDQLSTPYVAGDGRDSIDACLASNIIEVGVDFH